MFVAFPGYYLVLINLICLNGETKDTIIELSVKVNKKILVTNGMTDKKRMKAGTNGYATLQVRYFTIPLYIF